MVSPIGLSPDFEGARGASSPSLPSVFEPIPPRAPPARRVGALGWLRDNLFSGWASALATLAVLWIASRVLPPLYDWAVAQAVLQPDHEACRAVGHAGACWGVIAEKYRFILLGRYPFAEQWRPIAAMLLLVALLVASCDRRLWSRWLLVAWLAVPLAYLVLMGGGWFGLSAVQTDRWGGLPLTLLLTTVGIAGAFPLAILVALGRESHLPAIRALCVVYVELVRGVPLISVLFMASFMFPLLLPSGTNPDVLLRVLTGIVLFAGAYLAETVRGGLLAVPAGQREAAASLGLSYWQAQRKIILPQALRMVIPSIINSFISTFKDTSLVTIVGLYDLTGALTLALRGDPNWRQYYLEGYLFISLIYWVGCYSMSRYSRSIERRLDTGAARPAVE
jgi:general L-amino acid transport system permease protein